MAIDLTQMTIPDVTHWLPYTVVDAALARIAYAAPRYDELVVLFTGGKDSQLVLELVRRAYDGLGMTDRPVRFTFLDLEFLEDEVIRTAESYFADPRFEGVWVAAPSIEYMTVMGQRRDVVLWDETRRAQWGRTPPEHAVTKLTAIDRPFKPFEIFHALLNAMEIKWGPQARLGLLQGHRYGENAIVRRMFLGSDRDPAWIFPKAKGLAGVDFLRPIYDWTIKDVFRFFFDSGVPYCASYDINLHAGGELRAGTPAIDSDHSSRVDILRRSYPTLFTQMTTLWPELLTQSMYASEVDFEGVARSYGGDWSGMVRFIMETVPDAETQRWAIDAVKAARRVRDRNRRRGKYEAPCWGMPRLVVWKALVRGGYRDGIPDHHLLSKPALDFERWVISQGGSEL